MVSVAADKKEKKKRRGRIAVGGARTVADSQAVSNSRNAEADESTLAVDTQELWPVQIKGKIAFTVAVNCVVPSATGASGGASPLSLSDIAHDQAGLPRDERIQEWLIFYETQCAAGKIYHTKCAAGQNFRLITNGYSVLFIYYVIYFSQIPAHVLAPLPFEIQIQKMRQDSGTEGATQGFVQYDSMTIVCESYNCNMRYAHEVCTIT